MPSESVKPALYDIRDNILLASEFIEGLTGQQFGESRLHLRWTLRQMTSLKFLPPFPYALLTDILCGGHDGGLTARPCRPTSACIAL